MTAGRARVWTTIAVAGLGILSAGCGAGSAAKTVTERVSVTSPAPTVPALTLSATCERWQIATAAEQRALASKRAAIRGISVSAYLEQLADACTPARKALTLSEAIAAVNAPPPDEFASTRIAGTLAAYVAKSVRKSWNTCGEHDVCMPSTFAYSVGCHQPDPQVRVLSCFVTTTKGKAGQSDDYGYTVKSTVDKDGSFTWGIDRS
jgi:hypothetical protein